METIPGQASGLLEALVGCSAWCIVERFVIDTSVDELPWHTSDPELYLAIPDAVFEEIPWIEHISMPYHEYIYLRLGGSVKAGNSLPSGGRLSWVIDRGPTPEAMVANDPSGAKSSC